MYLGNSDQFSVGRDMETLDRLHVASVVKEFHGVVVDVEQAQMMRRWINDHILTEKVHEVVPAIASTKRISGWFTTEKMVSAQSIFLCSHNIWFIGTHESFRWMLPSLSSSVPIAACGAGVGEEAASRDSSWSLCARSSSITSHNRCISLFTSKR